MKKIAAALAVVLAAGVLFLAAIQNGGVKNPEKLRAAVVYFGESASAERAYGNLLTSAVSTLEAEKLAAEEISDLSRYDILYIDKSIISAPYFNGEAVQEFVAGGGSVFLDNETYEYFDRDFIGAEEYRDVVGCPVDMEYPLPQEKFMTKIQGLIWDFCDLYESDTDYFEALEPLNYGVGVIPSTAQVITARDGRGIYTLNQYGIGYVFFTNPILPNDYPEASPVISGADKLLRDYFAEFVSLKKYGYAVETVSASNTTPAAAWRSVSGENGETSWLEEICTRYGQLAPTAKTDKSDEYTSFLREYDITVPRGNAQTYFKAKYGMPLLFSAGSDNPEKEATEERVKTADRVTTEFGYSFVTEEQLAKMSSAALNTHVSAGRENNILSLHAAPRDKRFPLYDGAYTGAVGVKVIFDDNIAADDYKTDADISYIKDNCIYVSLNKTVHISKNTESSEPQIISVNLPCTIKRAGNETEIGFKTGGMMTVSVKGSCKTTSDGWETIAQDGKTTFRRYGGSDTLKITR